PPPDSKKRAKKETPTMAATKTCIIAGRFIVFALLANTIVTPAITKQDRDVMESQVRKSQTAIARMHPCAANRNFRLGLLLSLYAARNRYSEPSPKTKQITPNVFFCVVTPVYWLAPPMLYARPNSGMYLISRTDMGSRIKPTRLRSLLIAATGSGSVR